MLWRDSLGIGKITGSVVTILQKLRRSGTHRKEGRREAYSPHGNEKGKKVRAVHQWAVSGRRGGKISW